MAVSLVKDLCLQAQELDPRNFVKVQSVPAEPRFSSWYCIVCNVHLFLFKWNANSWLTFSKNSFLEIKTKILCAFYVPISFWKASHGPCSCLHHQWHSSSVPENERDAGKKRSAVEFCCCFSWFCSFVCLMF